MPRERRDDVRNVVIVAHVDHGKTTLVDALLWQSQLLRERGADPASLIRSLDLDRDKAITLMPKHLSFTYEGTKVNIIDAPGHADLAGEVDRVMTIADGVILVVDSCEGPVPQTRFALRKALEAGLAPIVVLSKIDRPASRPARVLDEVRELFRDLEARPEQSSFPVLYCNAFKGLCRTEPDGVEQPMIPLFRQILRTVPAPEYDTDTPLQMLVTSLDYDDFIGRLAVGKVFSGRIEQGSAVAHCRVDDRVVAARVNGLYGRDGERRVEWDGAAAGDLVEVAGIDAVRVGDTLSDPAAPSPLPPIRMGEAVLSVLLSVNDSPMAGFEGGHVAAGKLRERLWRELLTNVAVEVEQTERPDSFRLHARGELQLVMLIEMMRREGFEMSVGRPEVKRREQDGTIEEPVEHLVVDCPEPFITVVAQKVEARMGKSVRMVNHGTGRVRLEFRIPARGLIGFRSELLNDTKGTGIMNHAFAGYGPKLGEIASRTTGSLVADREGRCTTYAIGQLQHRGTMFVAPGDPVYEGMIVGENSRSNDLDVNITKARPSTPEGAVGGAPVRLIPPRSMGLEQAIEFIREDELVEVAPRNLRLRKKVASASKRHGDG